MKHAILLGAQGAATITIDGIVFQVLQTNTSGQLLVAQVASANSIVTGQTNVVTAGTRVQLAGNNAKAVRLRALKTNTKNIYFGSNAVSSAVGDILSPGESIGLSVNNLNVLWIDADVSGEGISWSVIN